MFKYLSTILGILTAGLYMHGQVFWQGYLSAFGLRSDILSLNFEESLIQGYVAYAILGAPIMVVAVLIVLLLVSLAYNLNEIATTRIVHRLLVERSLNGNTVPQVNGHPVLRVTIKTGFRALAALALIIFLVYGSLLIAGKVELLGQDSGETKRLELSKPESVSIVKMNSDKVIVGSIVTCNSGFCGILTEGRVAVFSLSDVYFIKERNSKSPK